MNNALEWIKGNVFIVVFCVIMIAAPVGMWLYTSGLNSDVQATMQQRANNLPKLASIRKVPIDFPGQPSSQGVINENFIELYTEVATALGKDADAVRAAAIEHNRKGRDVLMADVFPAMPPDRKDFLPEEFHRRLMAAYEALLKEINAGLAPSADSLRDDLARERERFISQDLQKDPQATLTADETRDLTERLTAHRLALYTGAAEDINVYLDRSTLAPPVWIQASMPSPSQLFRWQWEFWIINDVLKALFEANKADQKVYRAPVKRVLALAVAAPGESEGSRAAPTGGRGLGGPSGNAPGGSAAAPVPSADPKMQVKFDYSASITGRTTNPLYDVIYVTLDLVVDTERLPAVIDALSQYNFFTVTSLSVRPEDSFAAAREGYIYGPAPVSEVHMVLETIWLRDWIAPYMPDDLKSALGVPIPPKAPMPGVAPPDET
jgi:hypothetical protein